MSFLLPEIILKLQNYCAYQERCHQEVKNKLYELGCNTDTVNDVMVKLIETGFLNEERFAKAFAGGKFRTKKWGRLKIIRELKSRKISDYCIKSGLREIDEDIYIQTMQDLILKKAKPNLSWQEEQKNHTMAYGKRI
jgi:regulatory protein